ncbi:retinol dehydrogenase 13-like [Eriocheir sinensis]|uniref:retinol dehydrogenase 13-like n=1 Tax=Eriocheir sinensis TaxID=95602 RepID=UPI0021C6F6AC|nr:retinol dehydrogenase 13-like [Eriocheir sinensis]XP_050738273.1 retinol dehydrogenase 13-like [Eriocheir sinensis]XP_050738274.1 retinol dehydrogenase 13-like [Eriocheir sinensis]XP_050738275.1 retinol dehydrogenase 13-like [Eriocheir sinensis]
MWTEVLVTAAAVLAGAVVCLRLWYRSTAGRCKSTASMEGKTVLITGATAGIGKETARDLLRRGARVIIACRNLEKGARVAGELFADARGAGEVVVRHLDTSSLASVRTFAKEVLDTEKAIHVLINNAGTLSTDKRVTEDGLELTMATNYFGHFLLTNLLLGRLKESAPSRVVTVSSMCHAYPNSLDLQDLNFEKEPYTLMAAYNKSKLCNVLFANTLAEKTAGTGVTSNSLHPGIINTSILNDVPFTLKDFFFRVLGSLIAKDEATGAQTTIHLAVSEEVEGVTGQYFDECKEEVPSDLARRKDLATALWESSVRAVGLQQHETHC